MSIVLKQIAKRYGSHVIVDDLCLEVQDGEFFILLGASGSGKTTVLRIIAGLTRADSGRILLHERDVTDLAPQRREIGLVFQNYSIFRHMTVTENIEFGLKLRKLPRNERTRRRQELLDLVGLSGMGDRLPGQLSGGQQQRVALARALAYRPKVLLLDEPFGALDVKIRGQLRRSLRRIQEKSGVTTILVTHDQEEAFELADRIGVIERGRLLEVGPVEQLYFRPRTSFVATFLGAGTVVVGQVSEGKARFGELSLTLPDEIAAEENRRVQLLARPEQVILSDDPRGPGVVSLGQGRVIEEFFAGSHRKVRLRLPRLPGTRQLAPQPPFGEKSLLVDAVVSSSESLSGRRRFVGLRDYHILEAPPRRLLVLAPEGRGSGSASPLVRWLIRKLDASAIRLTVLEVTEAGAKEPKVEARAKTGNGGLEIRTRKGRLVSEVMAELQESLYDMVVVEAPPEKRFFSGAYGDGPELIDRLLKGSDLPVLILKGERERLDRLMICTAGGEPGKQDVKEGGWLARRLAIPVVLFHAVRREFESGPLTRAHLERAAATLHSLDLEVDIRLREAESVARAILEEARNSESDLIVVGRHFPRSRIFAGEDVTRQVISAADRPVLVIAVEEWRLEIPDVSAGSGPKL